MFLLWHRVKCPINVHGASLHSEPSKCFSDVNKETTNIQIERKEISQATCLPISSFCQLISYIEVCLFSIIKNIVNIYINCTTYIQIHTVLYSKILFLYCYPVAPCIASWTNFFDTSTAWYWQYKGEKWRLLMTYPASGQIFRRFGLCCCETQVSVGAIQGVGLNQGSRAVVTALLTALRRMMLHKGHSSVLRSTIIQKIMAKSLLPSVV